MTETKYISLNAQSDLQRNVIAADKISGQSFLKFVWELHDAIRINNVPLRILNNE